MWRGLFHLSVMQAGSETECERIKDTSGPIINCLVRFLTFCLSRFSLYVRVCVCLLQSALLTITLSSLCLPQSLSLLFLLRCWLLPATPPANPREWLLTTPCLKSQWMAAGPAEWWALINEHLSPKYWLVDICPREKNDTGLSSNINRWKPLYVLSWCHLLQFIFKRCPVKLSE